MKKYCNIPKVVEAKETWMVPGFQEAGSPRSSLLTLFLRTAYLASLSASELDRGFFHGENKPGLIRWAPFGPEELDRLDRRWEELTIFMLPGQPFPPALGEKKNICVCNWDPYTISCGFILAWPSRKSSPVAFPLVSEPVLHECVSWGWNYLK